MYDEDLFNCPCNVNKAKLEKWILNAINCPLLCSSLLLFFSGKGQPSSLIPEADTDNIETNTTWQCIITQNNFPGCKQHVSPLDCGKQLCHPYVIAQLVNCQDPWDAAQALLVISIVTFNYPLMTFYNKSGNKRYAGDRQNTARSRAQMIHVHHNSLNGKKQTDDGFRRFPSSWLSCEWL